MAGGRRRLVEAPWLVVTASRISWIAPTILLPEAVSQIDFV
jgi:hypothetical protein